jgi:hypothetical protein
VAKAEAAYHASQEPIVAETTIVDDNVDPEEPPF